MSAEDMIARASSHNTLMVANYHGLEVRDQCSDKAIKAKLDSCLNVGIGSAASIYDACLWPNTPRVAASLEVGYKKLVNLGIKIDIPSGPEMNAICESDFNVTEKVVGATCQSNASTQALKCGA